jgi:hypothetical protein
MFWTYIWICNVWVLNLFVFGFLSLICVSTFNKTHLCYSSKKQILLLLLIYVPITTRCEWTLVMIMDFFPLRSVKTCVLSIS